MWLVAVAVGVGVVVGCVGGCGCVGGLGCGCEFYLFHCSNPHTLRDSAVSRTRDLENIKVGS